MMSLLNLVAAAIIFTHGLFFSLNQMNRHTMNLIRVAWIGLTTGALAILIGPLYGWCSQPSYPEFMLNFGLAIYVIADRRRVDNKRIWP